MKNSPDKKMAALARQGDMAAWEELVGRHYGFVFGIAYARLGDVEAAEDLAQEVFLRLFVHIKALRDTRAFAPWAAQVTRNLATNWKRDAQRRSQLLPLIPDEEAKAMDVPDDAPSARDLAERAEEQRLARAVIERLPDEERELVVLHYMEGLSQREIARRLGVNSSTVGRRLDACLARLHREFESNVGAAFEAHRRRRAHGIAKASAFAAAFAALGSPARARIIEHAAFAQSAGMVADAAVSTSAAVTTGVAGTIVSIGAAIMPAKKVVVVAIILLITAGLFVATRKSNEVASNVQNTFARQAVPQVALSEHHSSPSPEPGMAISEDAGAVDYNSVPLLTPPRATEPDELAGISFVARGRVLNEAGRPIAGAKLQIVRNQMRLLTGIPSGGHPVVMEPQTEATAYSQSDGTYELRAPHPLPLTVTVAAKGYGMAAEFINDSLPGRKSEGVRPLKPGTLMLQRDFILSEAHVLRGTVIDEMRNGIQGVEVAAHFGYDAPIGIHYLPIATETDSLGEFEFAGFGKAPLLLLTARKEGYMTARMEVANPVQSNVVLQLTDGGATVGGVTLDWKGNTLAGVNVVLGSVGIPSRTNNQPLWFETTSSSNGAFQFEHIPSGDYFLSAQLPDGRRMLTRENTPALTLSISKGDQISNLEVRLFDGYTVTGIVRDTVTNEGVPGVEVRSLEAGSQPASEVSVTDEKGAYRLTRVQGEMRDWAGSALLLRATKERYIQLVDRAEPLAMLEPGRMEYNIDLAMSPHVEWRGRVLLPTRQPAAAVKVQSEDIFAETTITDSRGEFAMMVPMHGEAQIKVIAEGYPDTYSEVVEVGIIAPPPVEVIIDPGATAVLRVTDEDGMPIEGASAGMLINAYGDQWSPALRSEQGITGADGRMRIERIPTKGKPISIQYRSQSIDFTAQHQDYGSEQTIRGVAFEENELKEVLISLPPQDDANTYSVAGKVTNAEGKPVEHANITIKTERKSFTTRTDAQGHYSHDLLPPGPYDIVCNHSEISTHAHTHFFGAIQRISAGSKDADIVIGVVLVDLTFILTDEGTGDPIESGRVLMTLPGKRETLPGITDIKGAHRFPRYFREARATFIITAPGYRTVTLASLEVPREVSEHIQVVEMVRE